jgi:hypothetical protein
VCFVIGKPSIRRSVTPDGIERNAGLRFVAMAFHLKPAKPAVEALADGCAGPP